MEHHPIMFPPASSSHHSSGQSVLSSSMLQPQAFDKLLGETARGFTGLKGEHEAASLGWTGGYPRMEATTGSDDEMKAAKKKGAKNVRKPKYAFQTRSQVDILDDGYRWRKYGQKAVKNNRFPRSYYRCTHQGCIVKKQVQRLSKDEGVVVTTYEGTHTHPIEKSNDNFEHILNEMKIFTNF
ncbi:unnamed protein product [Spirodela intermedia]|uniref:WRKY domain-containing protein n=1 Tax=Spirodela intermedia TaxID=51605 RepID=A0A7I8KGZ4_SPIIN|nr:unnamed protein product [Spirodela intermedia]